MSKINKNSLIKRFEKHLNVEKEFSENTIKSYMYDVKKFCDFVEDNNKDFLKITKNDIQKFLSEQENKKKISYKTQARSLAAIRDLYDFLKKVSNPTDYIDRPSIPREVPEFLTEEEINEFFNLIPEDTEFHVRDKALFELLYSGGLKISEAIELKLDSINLEKLIVAVNEGTDLERVVSISPEAGKIIEKYILEVRDLILNKRESDYLFISKKGSNLNRRSAWRLLKQHAGKIKTDKNITPNILRHSFAMRLVMEGEELHDIQNILGHQDISTARIYNR